MVSPEVIRRYPFFAGLDLDQLDTVAGLGEDRTVGPDHVFFRENEAIDRFYVLVSGTVAVFMEVPDTSRRQSVAGQLTGAVRLRQVTVSTIGAGEVFGFSALVPPPMATAGAKAITDCRVVVFDARRLLELFETDCRLGYLITQKAASVMRMRLRDLHIETVALQEPLGGA